MTNSKTIAQKMKCSSYSPAQGTAECFITGVSTPGLTLKESFADVAAAYLAELTTHSLDLSTQQFMRIYIGDMYNDEGVFLESALATIASHSAFSIIGQSPLGSAAVGILAYHIKTPAGSFEKEFLSVDNNYNNQSVIARGSNYSLLWLSNYIDLGGAFDSYKQSASIFTNVSESLAKNDMTIRNNCIRTWLYVHDVDNHYCGMVEYRKQFFTSIGLTNDTRYIASTGINGSCVNPKTLVTLDALSVQDIKEEQIIRMSAPDYLSDTIVYGVTFERGFRIQYGDRSHLYISGTASIDADGKTVYLSDVRKQTVRTLDNIDALLKPHGATMSDMKYLIIYLRNRKHWDEIQDLLLERIPECVATICVEAAVCRPNWLIEIEGVGVVPDATAFPPFA